MKMICIFVAGIFISGCVNNKVIVSPKETNDLYLISDNKSFGCVPNVNTQSDEDIIQNARAHALAKLSAYQNRTINGTETLKIKSSTRSAPAVYIQKITTKSSRKFTLSKIIKQWSINNKFCVQVQLVSSL